MKNLVLVGFMGSGKSVVGKWLADRLGMSFVDMDEVIEQRRGKSISDIFRTDGEEVFRKMERSLVIELASRNSQVIAAGGGVILERANVDDFEKAGIVVCLGVTPNVAHQRTKESGNRPLLEGVNRWAQTRKLYKERETLYSSIRHQVDTSDKGMEAVVQEVMEIYKRNAAAT